MEMIIRSFIRTTTVTNLWIFVLGDVAHDAEHDRTVDSDAHVVLGLTPFDRDVEHRVALGHEVRYLVWQGVGRWGGGAVRR